MILVAESGSTKTDWRSIHQEYIFESAGYNPQVIDREFVVKDLQLSLPEDFDVTAVQQLFFYGAGCATPAAQDRMKSFLSAVFPSASIQVESDLLAACRSVLGNDDGLVGILGTGSNLCLFQNQEVIQKTTNLGYLLGDEGSGGDIAKRVIRAGLYGELPSEIIEDILGVSSENFNSFISELYRQERVNKHLASFMPKVHIYKDQQVVNRCILESLSSFVDNHVCKYSNQYAASLVGSVAHLYQEELSSIFHERGYELKQVVKKPIDGLLKYHSSRLKQ